MQLAGFPSISSREAGLGQLVVKVVSPSPEREGVSARQKATKRGQ